MANTAADSLRSRIGTVTTFDQMLNAVADAMDPPETKKPQHDDDDPDKAPSRTQPPHLGRR